MNISAIILAGGKSRRFGRDKTTEVVGRKCLIERVIERLQLLTDEILLVTSQEHIHLPIDSNVEYLVDYYPEKGPIGGIYTGLAASRSAHCIVVACDMPFLNVNLLGYMVGLSPSFDAVVPKLGDEKLEPLHAVYSQKCLAIIEDQLKHNQLRADSYLNTMQVRYVVRAECQTYDPWLLSFFNVNNQCDLDQANMIASDSLVPTMEQENFSFNEPNLKQPSTYRYWYT